MLLTLLNWFSSGAVQVYSPGGLCFETTVFTSELSATVVGELSGTMSGELSATMPIELEHRLSC